MRLGVVKESHPRAGQEVRYDARPIMITGQKWVSRFPWRATDGSGYAYRDEEIEEQCPPAPKSDAPAAPTSST